VKLKSEVTLAPATSGPVVLVLSVAAPHAAGDALPVNTPRVPGSAAISPELVTVTRATKGWPVTGEAGITVMAVTAKSVWRAAGAGRGWGRIGWGGVCGRRDLRGERAGQAAQQGGPRAIEAGSFGVMNLLRLRRGQNNACMPVK
jgi:hypothetical protein